METGTPPSTGGDLDATEPPGSGEVLWWPPRGTAGQRSASGHPVVVLTANFGGTVRS
ncbi:hypothetical protein [Streptomyces phaeolivaceus]|uniref:hypothetical protein n=1 Tax=Streptomyces phaeolivaceus TaxID=2653200 RepID=UPI001869EB9E|nr:hypothetical protein [Streptomyces phaeolivaceus]